MGSYYFQQELTEYSSDLYGPPPRQPPPRVRGLLILFWASRADERDECVFNKYSPIIVEFSRNSFSSSIVFAQPINRRTQASPPIRRQTRGTHIRNEYCKQTRIVRWPPHADLRRPGRARAHGPHAHALHAGVPGVPVRRTHSRTHVDPTPLIGQIACDLLRPPIQRKGPQSDT